jgi:glycosyltransferase involved in cell wall biosynthesis
MLVSILIPAYNAEKWVAQTIESALSQTWPKKEIILVDDGSTDNSLKIMKRMESKIVKIISQENKGASAARNKAMAFAQGDYIQWLDSDDLLAPDKISRQLNSYAFDRNSRGLLSSGFGSFYYRPLKARFIPTSLWQDLTPVEWLLKKYNENIWMNPAVWLVSRKLAELAGPWDERLSLDDDGEYFTRVIAASEEIKFVQEAKSYYRVGNARSLSHSVTAKAISSLFLSISLNIKYLRSLEDSERTRSACLKYLQTWLIYFYPDQKDILQRANLIARELGGELTPPEVRWKYLIIRKIFGWETGKMAEQKIPMLKQLFRSKWDKVLYKMSGN